MKENHNTEVNGGTSSKIGPKRPEIRLDGETSAISRRGFLGRLGGASGLALAGSRSALAMPVANNTPRTLPKGDSSGSAGDERYYQHTFFDNSRDPERYFYSSGSFFNGSWLRLVDGRLPVETDIFFTPPNALRLEWRSHPQGGWEAALLRAPWRNRDPHFSGDVLRFWCFSPTALPAGVLPHLQANDAADGFSAPLPLSELVAGLPGGRWFQFEIPLERLPSASLRRFDPLQLQSLSLLQGVADDIAHVLILDEFRIESSRVVVKSPPPPPAGLHARGYDRHIDVSWQPVASPEVKYYTVYRSSDGRQYQPIGTQPAGMCRYVDFVGEQRASFSYRVTAVAGGVRESAPSTPATAAAKPLDDDGLLEMVQEASFRYYWEGAHPVSGMTRESMPGDDAMVATGATGFGIMALLVGAHRGFSGRAEIGQRLLRTVEFLEQADRFHGAWAHFMDGATGRALPVFGKYDNGGDLVETAFLMQGLLAARGFFSGDNDLEDQLRRRITQLWRTVEWDWYRNPAGSDYLVWHWSPDYGFRLNHHLIGFNETMVTYLLAIASPTHPVPPSMYSRGWASQTPEAQRYRQGWGQTTDGNLYRNGHSYYGIPLAVGVGSGGPLFFTHYSYMGFDPRGIRDNFTNYFDNNVCIAKINLAYCTANPGGYRGYGPDCWGLTASDGPSGYKPHAPDRSQDDGTITPTGAVSSMPYTPAASLRALKHFYRDLGARMWGVYGFYDAMNLEQDRYARIYMGLNQAPMTVMIENNRSQLVWNAFMSNPEIRPMLDRIGFVPDSRPAESNLAPHSLVRRE